MDSEHLIADALAHDPSGGFGLMDHETRLRYHLTVHELARCSGLRAEEVANRARALARAALAHPPANPATTHVGYYLFGPGARAFRRSLLHASVRIWTFAAFSMTLRHLIYGTLILVG